jgi:phenylacetate-CoA ligase
MMIVRGVNVFPTQIEELILQVPSLAPHYQIELSREGHLDSMSVAVEIRSNSLTESERQAAAKELRHLVKSLVGVSINVIIKGEGGVPRSQGKAQRVLDNRKII